MRCEAVSKSSEAKHSAASVCSCFTRRTLLRTTTMLAAGAALSVLPAAAQSTVSTSEAKPHRIDVHHHFYPPFLQEAWQKASVRTTGVVRDWTLAKTLDQMDRNGVATAVLSSATGLNLAGLDAEQT
jgi:hypothetical protein